jgi:hypothetical protein
VEGGAQRGSLDDEIEKVTTAIASAVEEQGAATQEFRATPRSRAGHQDARHQHRDGERRDRRNTRSAGAVLDASQSLSHPRPRG